MILHLETGAAVRIEPAFPRLEEDQLGLMELAGKAGECAASGEDLQLELPTRFDIHSVEIHLAGLPDPTMHLSRESNGLSLGGNVVRSSLLQNGL